MNNREKVKEFVNQSSIVLFIKGDPEKPLCKFTKKILKLFISNNIKFTHQNVRKIKENSEELYEEIKTFSNWKTFPQVFVDGEFIGGLDICEELIESGELFDIISQKCPSCHFKRNEKKNVFRIRLPSSDILEYEYNDKDTINTMINKLNLNNEKFIYLEEKSEILKEHFYANLMENFGEEGAILIAVENIDQSSDIKILFGFAGVSLLCYYVYKKFCQE